MEKYKTYKNEDIDEMFLCRPCAEKMKGMQTVKSVKIGSPGSKKGTCEHCGCRRYGYHCEVEFGVPNREETTKRSAV